MIKKEKYIKRKENDSLNNIKKKVNNIKEYSLINTYIQEKRIDKEFILIISSISLEDLIALKLEITSRLLKGRILFPNFLISVKYMVIEAIIKYILSISENKKDIVLNLGIKYKVLSKIIEKMNIDINKNSK